MTRLLYLDTNIILARYAPDEPQHEAAEILLREIEGGRLNAVTSILTLVEVLSAISRACERFAKEAELRKREDIAGIFLRRVVAIRNLDFIPMGGEVSINIEEQHLELPALFALALEIGSKTGIKTLDNLHLAAASITSQIYGQRIDYFVTLDNDLLRHHEDIETLIEIEVSTPAEVAESLSSDTQ